MQQFNALQEILEERESRSTKILPKAVYAILGGVNQLAEAFEVAAGTINQATYDLSLITSDLLIQQREQMQINHATAMAKAQAKAKLASA